MPHRGSQSQNDWWLANPWVWLATGLVITAISWIWTIGGGEAAGEARVVVLAVGLVFAGTGVWVRWHEREIAHRAGPRAVGFLRWTLGGLFGLIGLAITGLLILSFQGRYGMRAGGVSLLFVTSVPLCFLAWLRCWNAKSEPSSIDLETALTFIALGTICYLGSYTLYLGPRLAERWDTLRMFLRVAGAVCWYGAALVVVSVAWRRIIVSLLIAVHFVGIASTCLLPAPSPWIVGQAWTRVFRPYLEFMFLTNPYHFFAPEPGAYSYLWFRIIYTDPSDPAKPERGWWYRVPQLDAQGRIGHPTALEYQRYLMLTESIAPSDPAPVPFLPTGEIAPFYARRLERLPRPNQPLGQQRDSLIRVPLHPNLSQPQQVDIPNASSRNLLSSYARFLARKYARAPEAPSWVFQSVKIYRAVHAIPPITALLNGFSPGDPELYHPFYLGRYDAAGEPIEEQDPFLFWLLPVVRETPGDPASAIYDFARLHAGDPRWYRSARGTEWTEPPTEVRPAR